MNDANLEHALSRWLAVDDAAVARVRAAVQAAVRTARARRRNAWLGAATLAAAASVVLLARSGDAATQPGLELHIRVTVDRTDADHDEPPPLSWVAQQSDWVLVGRVAGTSGGVVRFEVREQVAGRSNLGALVELDRAHDVTYTSDREDNVWRDGEELLLALYRDPVDGAIKVKDNRSGQGRFPLDGIVGLADFLRALRGRTIPPERLAHYVERHGPRAINTLRHQLRGLVDIDRDATKSPAVQAALVRSLASPNDREAERTALQYLTPAALRSLPAAQLDALVARAIDEARGASSPHTAVALLAPFARAGLRGVEPMLRGTIEDAEVHATAKPSAYGWSRLLLDACEAWWHLEPEAARDAVWRRYAALPSAGEVDAGHALGLLLAKGDPHAPAELVARSRALHAAGNDIWLDLLITREDTDAREVLRGVLGDRAYSLGRNRYDHSPADPLGQLKPEVARAHLVDLRDVLLARLRDEQLGVYGRHDWLALYLLGFHDLAPFAAALARDLQSVERVEFGAVQLVRLVDDVLGARALPYFEPTDTELRAAGRALAARLGG